MAHHLELNAKKIIRHFGLHPERGKALPCLPKKRVTVGMRWSLPKLDYVPDDDVRVNRMVALQHVRGSTWRVLCEEAYWPAVMTWLLEYCR